MRTFLDYVFYRVSKFYEDWEGFFMNPLGIELNTHISGAIVLAMTITFVFLSV